MIDTDSLKNARFYATKTEPITDVDIVAEAPLERPELIKGKDAPGTLTFARVHRGGGNDLYQLVVDKQGRDILGEEETARAAGKQLSNGYAVGSGVLHKLTDPALPPVETVRAVGEQSNTSWIYNDRVIVKYFRRLTPTPNPEIELLEELTAAGCTHSAPLRGWTSVDLEGSTYVTAMLQDLVPGTDGYDFVTGTPDAFDATPLGEAIRDVHAVLASTCETSTLAPGALATNLDRRLTGLVGRAPQLKEYEEKIRALYSTLAETSVPTQRIHGDLHLGQTLVDGDSWVLIDFEGEPAASLEERRRPDSPLRDVAGMIRSFGYAAAASGQDQGWADARTAELIAGYGEVDEAILRAYIADKCAYEVVYELENRPHMVHVPLDALASLV